MTYEELKAEADKLGYNLVKKNQYIKFLPCTCGSNRRHTVFCVRCEKYPDGRLLFECNKCGKSSPVGKHYADAKAKWNKMIQSENV